MGPKVSIIVPVCNAEAYLEECLASIAQQTLRDIEVVCIDDGSTDKSPELLAAFARRDPRFRIITKENAGYGAAMNDGLAAATGEYIGCVESDDFIEPEMFERLYEVAHANDADVVKCDFFETSGAGATQANRHFEICPGKDFYGRVLDSTKSEALFYCVMMTWEGIYRKGFIEEHGIRHNESPGASFQDNGFWFQVFLRARRVVFLNEAYYHYRVDNSGSSTHSSAAAARIFGEFAYVRELLERDPRDWARMATVYSYFYFDNLVARLGHIAPEDRAEVAARVGREWLACQGRGEVDRSLFPPLLIEVLDEVASDPGAYRPEGHASIEVDSWDEVAARHGRTEMLRESISPYSVVSQYVRCIVEDAVMDDGARGQRHAG